MKIPFALLGALCLNAINGLIMPITKSDGSLDVSSLLSHIGLLEQSLEKKASAADMTKVHDELNAAQSKLSVLEATLNKCSCSSSGTQNLATSSEVRSLQTDMGHLKQEVFQLQNKTATKGGTTFTRWGRTSCPADSTAVYKGYTGGTWYAAKGGSASIVCLPDQPIYPPFTPKDYNGTAAIFGTEYETFNSINPLHHLHDEDMPCVVCENSRSSSIMIAGRNACYPGWTLEYWGYLMGGYMGDSSAEYICIDSNPEATPGGEANDIGRTLALVKSICGSLSCPPYEQGRDMSCAVCSK